MRNTRWSEVRLMFGVLLIVATGLWGVIITFSDPPAGSSTMTWAAYLASWHIPSAVIAGWLFAPRWALGAAVGWGAILMLFSYTAFVAGTIVAAAIILASYLGGRIAKVRGDAR